MIRHEVTGNVAQTCRYYGISWQTYYSWLRRYEEFGLYGLRSKSPKISSWATPAKVVSNIVYVRSNHDFGPQKIRTYLERYHEMTISASGIWRILKRPRHEPAAELAAPQAAPPALETLREAAVGTHDRDRRQVHRPLKGSRKGCCYQFTAINVGTRLRVLSLYDRLNQKTAIQFIDYALERFPFRVDVIQTHNGSEFPVCVLIVAARGLQRASGP